MRRFVLFIILSIILGAFSAPIQAKGLSKLKTYMTGVEGVSVKSNAVSPGDVLFEQFLAPSNIVQVPEGREIFIRKTGNTYIKFAPSSRLYEVRDKNDVRAYCSYEPTFLATPKIGKPIRLISCLSDSDGDSRFDRVFSSTKGQLDLPPYIHFALGEHKKAFDPIAFTPVENSSQIFATPYLPARVLYKNVKKGKHIFDFQIQTTGGEWVQSAREEIALSNGPHTQRVFGAELSIEKQSGDTLSVDVISGLRDDQIFTLTAKQSKNPLTFIDKP